MLFAAIRAGASGYLLKQISSEDLIRSLNSVARGDAALLDPMVTQRVFQEVRRAVKEEEASAFAVLSQQEKHVLMLVSEGKTNREIAKSLFLGEGTVRNYVSNILVELWNQLQLPQIIDTSIGVRKNKGYTDSEQLLSPVLLNLSGGSAVEHLKFLKEQLGIWTASPALASSMAAATLAAVWTAPCARISSDPTGRTEPRPGESSTRSSTTRWPSFRRMMSGPRSSMARVLSPITCCA